MRTGSVYDWIIDSSGAIFALGTLSLRKKSSKQFSRRKRADYSSLPSLKFPAFLSFL
jgi:hypothetical protein